MEKQKTGNHFPELEEAYAAIMKQKAEYGIYHKTCFHIHTPASPDYKLFRDQKSDWYKKSTAEELFEACLQKRVFPSQIRMEDVSVEGIAEKKEQLSYLLLANALMENGIAVALVTDHNTIDGVSKLAAAVKALWQFKKSAEYPQVILGIEISCADTAHVVGIFERGTEEKIKKWLNENLLSEADGSFRTSIDVLKFIQDVGGIGYIAHINAADILFKGSFSGGYKEKLFSDTVVQIVGVSELNQIDHVQQRTRQYKKASKADVKFVLDNDAHDVETLSEKCFWLKGRRNDFSMIREALIDYDISVSFELPQGPEGFIQGLYIKSRDSGFLQKRGGGPFCLTFSNALNCLIGGRGTGKSTVLELLEFVLSQKCTNEARLKFLCALGNTWVLYTYKGENFLVEMRMPQKSDDDKSILRYFGQNQTDRYYHKYYFVPNDVKAFAQEHYLKIYKAHSDGTTLSFSLVQKKGELLRKFFDVRYSVNDLVNTASGKSISEFLYSTLFANKTLSQPEKHITFYKKSGLKKCLQNIDSILQQRQEDVAAIINPFNEHQKGILKIVYSQKEEVEEPCIRDWIFEFDASERSVWYKGYNISTQNIEDYFQALYDIVGVVRFFLLATDGDVAKAFETLDPLDFCEPMTLKMAEHGIRAMDKKDAHAIFAKLFHRMLSDHNITEIRHFLQKYIKGIEHFSLEFNVNNREGSSDGPNYKPVETLSMGQKVVAMLSFVLGYSEYSGDYRPLIIDQPEDNLDNQYIYKNLVSQLRQIKEKRQVIIATHNATIVTNAKADQVCVMDSDNLHGWVEKRGYPVEKCIKKQIIAHLEGGPESFLHKIRIYEDALGIKILETL